MEDTLLKWCQRAQLPFVSLKVRIPFKFFFLLGVKCLQLRKGLDQLSIMHIVQSNQLTGEPSGA